MNIRLILSVILVVVATAYTPYSALGVEITYSVGYWSYRDCRGSPTALDPLEACKKAWPGFAGYSISPTGGQGNMADDPYVEGPVCIGHGSSGGKQIVKLCASAPLEDNLGEDCDLPYFGNPINAATGNKFQKETDYVSEKFGLSATRYYNSSLGHGWKFLYTDELEITPYAPDIIIYARPDGFAITFKKIDGSWTSSKNNYSLNQIGDQWEIYEHGGESRVFDHKGALLSVTTQNDSKKTLVYSDISTPKNVAPEPGYLVAVKDSSGKSLHYGYDSSGRIVYVEDLSGARINYVYDSLGRLSKVKYPDETSKEYLYNELEHTSSTDIPTALTGIIGKSGVRSSTFKYDSEGRAVYTSGKGESGGFKFDFKDGMTVVTRPNGVKNNVTFEKVNGRVLIKSQTYPGGHSCSSSNNDTMYMSYTDDGWLKTKTDLNGNITEYSYDANGREIYRIVGKGTSEEKIIETEWHPTLDRKVKVVEGGKTTILKYDDNGNLIAKRTLPTQ